MQLTEDQKSQVKHWIEAEGLSLAQVQEKLVELIELSTTLSNKLNTKSNESKKFTFFM